ncbi:glycine zipper 2TM domain-containing protein [Aliiroseovarius sp. YM-037]|uniref:glycine zipper 2TM domain-containing protein n=1 Tax=Aliiroseovarius sp. YM-037 TaxID=3341728 RepID=UPI003A7FE649
MKKTILALPLVLIAAGCETTEQSAIASGLGGAALGAAVSSGEDRTRGALIGAAAGVAAGTLIDQANRPGDCIYENSRGQRYVAKCP